MIFGNTLYLFLMPIFCLIYTAIQIPPEKIFCVFLDKYKIEFGISHQAVEDIFKIGLP